LRTGILAQHLQIIIVCLPICRGHVTNVEADDPEQTLSLRPIPSCKSGKSDRRVWEIDFNLEFILKRNRVVADNMELAGLDSPGLYPHALLAEIKSKSVDLPGPMPFVALIDYRNPQRNGLGWRRNLSLTVTLLKLISVLNRANELQAIKAAKAVLVREKSATRRTLFHQLSPPYRPIIQG